MLPGAIVAVTGLTVIDDSVAELTVSEVVPETLPKTKAAPIVMGPPAATPTAFPGDAMVATAVELELHITSRLRSWVELSLKKPVAK
jgi:hypothetical protein